MPCKMCRQRGKDWGGDDPKCAFDAHLDFGDNWMCATLNAIRDICYEGQREMPPGVDYRYCEDQKYATIKIDEIECSGERIGYCPWVCWYKNRGGTDAVWILDSYEPPRRPTEGECLAIIEYYEGLKKPAPKPRRQPLLQSQPPPTTTHSCVSGKAS